MKAKALCAVLLPVVAVGGYCLWPRPVSLDFASPAPVAAPASPAVAESNAASLDAPVPEALPEYEAAPTLVQEASPAEVVDIAVAVEQKTIAAEFAGNGRDRLLVIAMNKSSVPLRVQFPVGQMFESEGNTVVVVRPGEIEVAPGRTCDLVVQTAATRSLNRVTHAPYRLSQLTTPKIELFLTYLQNHLEISPAAIQTAILALTDNLPLNAVAKFTIAGGALPSRFNTDAFRVETYDIIAALTALKELGVKDSSIAMTIDPQLRIEAMIDPLARLAAMRYYGITPAVEWEFWRSELLAGEPSTRHYALYGIARFFPDVALQMLPRWARETRTNPVYRLSAVQALADTQRPEALTLLRDLTADLGATTELGKAAVAAADYLDYRLAELAKTHNAVALQQAGAAMPF